jgi:peptidoglycan-associated lipoprotein
MKKSFVLALTASVVLSMSACSKKDVKEEGDATGANAVNPTAIGNGQAGSPIAELPAVYFAYDSFALAKDGKKALDKHAAWLKANPGRGVQVEGHCDERGTNQYNMALGERRAGVVKDYLVGKGVPASQLSTISYGEERPAVQGADEATWTKNRRAEFVNIGQ